MTRSAQKPEQMLAQVDLFKGLSNRQLRQLLEVSREVEHPSGHVIAAEGEGGLAFHVILSGEATVSIGGKEIRRLAPGDYFGEISMIDGRPRSATVTASSPLRVLALPHAGFTSVLDKDTAFARHLLANLCARLRAAETRG